MAKVAVFIADGSEEVEAITPVDILRRAKVEVDVVSVMPEREIVASRNVRITADKLLDEISFDDYDLLVLPGGVRGTNNLNACEELKKNLVRFNDQGNGIAAICAASLSSHLILPWNFKAKGATRITPPQPLLSFILASI